MTKTLYEKHQREYTVVGISGVFQEFFAPGFAKFYGDGFEEIICVIKDGIFYHYQVIGDRERISRLLLNQISKGAINLEKEYTDFDKQVTEFEAFMDTAPSKFNLHMINEFYRYYRDLIGIAYLGMDPIDFIDILDKGNQEYFREWATKIRLRGEVVYKNGEMKFIPKFLDWLVRNHLPKYTLEQLKYLVFDELEAFSSQNKNIPSPEELTERKKLFYLRQYRGDNIEYYNGKEAQAIIDEKELLKQKSDELENIKELKGQIAFKGKVVGKARLIRSTNDMKDFQEGEIIISPMTQPNYLPIMKKAIAFITNDGGMLCHAAIVAREMKKPCITGTKLATHVFKDGDMIEVDADNGIVRKTS